MLKPGANLFVWKDTPSGERILLPSLVIEVHDEIIAVTMETDEFTFECEQEVLIYYHHERDFVQQTAQVSEVDELGSSQVIELTATSDRISANARASFRVTTATAGARVCIEEGNPCPVRDASLTGFSIVSSLEFTIGRTVDVEFNYAGEVFHGTAIVQSARTLASGLIRYGMRCPEGEANDSLLEGLRSLTMETQRRQLSRTRGS